MLRLLIFLIFLVASVWLGLEIFKHPGYLMIVYHPWLIQIPIWFAILSFLILLLLFYLLINGIDRLHLLAYQIKSWLRLRQEQKAFSTTQHGLAALIEGRDKVAEQLLIRGATKTNEPLINYLGAARAAQAQNALDRRDRYMQKAYQAAPQATIAIGLAQAELEMAQHQYEHAAATLNHLRQMSPKQPQVIKLLEKTYTRLADWTNLLTLIPSLKKAKILTDEEFQVFEKNLHVQLLRHPRPNTLTQIEHLYAAVPRALRKHPEIVLAYVEQLARYPDTQATIEEVIQKTLKTTWSSDLILFYSQLIFKEPHRQLAIADQWVKTHGQKPELLFLLGKICVQVQLWGKAKDYFERCLSYGPNPYASLAYGQLLEHLDQRDGAIEKYRDGLKSLIAEDPVTLKLIQK